MQDFFLYALNEFDEPVPVQCDPQGRLYIIPELSCAHLQRQSPIISVSGQLAHSGSYRFGQTWQRTDLNIHLAVEHTLVPLPENRLFYLQERPEYLALKLITPAQTGIWRINIWTDSNLPPGHSFLRLQMVDEVVVTLTTTGRPDFARVYYPASAVNIPPPEETHPADPVKRIPAGGGYRIGFRSYLGLLLVYCGVYYGFPQWQGVCWGVDLHENLSTSIDTGAPL